ncbi:MAG: MFS transporter, partial [Kordiimonadaceae bacterium]|nr:MFS transporter [Kordiimonadaceae bacterium]
MPNQIDSYPKPLYAWYTTALLLLIYTFSFIDRQILSLLGPAIKADFGISDTQFGLLTGPAFALFYAIFGLFCARLADSKNRKYLIAAGLFLWSLMTAASGFARSFMSLFILRVGVGVGEATLSPAANSILADSFPKKKLGMVMSVYAMGIPIGSALAFYIGGTAIELAADLPDVTVPGFGTVSDWQKTLLVV